MGKKYKMKTHKATAKRFKVTGSGKLMRTRGPKSHFRRRTSKRAWRELSRMVAVKGVANQKRIHKLAPYIGKYGTRASRRGGGSKK